jgi:hypothetical protein
MHSVRASPVWSFASGFCHDYGMGASVCMQAALDTAKGLSSQVVDQVEPLLKKAKEGLSSTYQKASDLVFGKGSAEDAEAEAPDAEL